MAVVVAGCRFASRGIVFLPGSRPGSSLSTNALALKLTPVTNRVSTRDVVPLFGVGNV